MKESAEITTVDGIKLFTRSWIIENPKAIVYFHHGLGEHIDRYAHVFQKFNEAGIQVHGFDCRGHGRTLQLNKGMAMCHISDWENTVHDIKLITETYLSDKPSFLMGHSMGGLLVLKYALEKGADVEFQGIISCSPAIKNATPIIPLKYWSGRVFAPIFPRLTVKTGLDIGNISRVPEVITAYNNDSLVHPNISLQTASLILKSGDNIAKLERPQIHANVLLAHGSGDRITSFEASKQFFEKLLVARSHVKESMFIEGAYHEIHNDLCAEEVISKYINWILMIARSEN